jgi:hypothetical protein
VQTFANAAARTAAIPTPTEGIVSYLIDTNALELYNNGWNVINPSSGNAIINGGFDIWQRGTSFTNPAQGAFLADRWRYFSGSTGATRVFSRQSFTANELNVASFGEAPFYFRVNQSVAGTGDTFNQIQNAIEDVRTFAGQTVTLSFYAKTAASTTIPGVRFFQNFGSGGSAEGAVTLASSLSLTTAWTRYSFTATLPSISGKTIGANNFLGFQILLPNNAIFTFDIWGVQLEAGAVATPFKRNAPSIQAELAACQRYYEAGSHPFEYRSVTINAFVTVSHRVTFFKVTKRVSPSVTVTRGASDNAVAGNGVMGGVTNDNFVHTIGINDTNFPYVGLAYSWTAAAEL